MNPQPRPLLERFMEKFIPEPMSGCWLWTAAQTGRGYGKIGIGRTNANGHQWAQEAHRVSYELFKGPIAPELEIDHKCRVLSCVNPDHLEAVTPSVNVRRGLAGDLKIHPTHCPHGHEYSASNTLYYFRRNSFDRVCKACRHEKYLAKVALRKNACLY